MIQNKKDLEYYLECDRIALNKNYKKPKFKHDIIWTFERYLRYCEYINNCKKGLVWNIIGKLLKFRYVGLSQKLGFSIGFNVFGPGLAIQHYGCLVVNGKAKVGENCRIHEGVCIGASGGKDVAAIIGNNVFIGTGAKIIGDVRISDNVVIGANAVVVNDIDEPGTSWAGSPAKKISNNGSELFCVRATEIVHKGMNQ